MFVHVSCSQSRCFIASFRSCQIFFVRTKTCKKTSCPFSSLKKPKRRKFGSHCFQLRTSPTNEAKAQNTTSASHTKLLENGCDSKTFTARESSTDVDRPYRPRDFLFLASQGMVSKKCLENEEILTRTT